MLALYQNSGATIDSREVADMVSKDHNTLLRDIRTYCGYLGESNLVHSDFFIENTYQSEQNKIMPCYLVTRKGCEMIANKMTGRKGVLFTASYITRFHALEQRQLPQSLPEALRLYADSLEANKALQIELDRDKEWYSIKRVAALNSVSWKRFDWHKLKKESERQGVEARKIFDANYGEANIYHQSVWESVYPQYEL